MTISPLRLACPPRFATSRDFDRPTLGPAVAEVARRLRKPLMPWQQYVADVVMEIDPATGRLAYDEFRITVPRQSGKSTLVLAKAVHRASATPFFGPRQQIVYTAQTRKDARKKFEEDFFPDLEAAPVFRARDHWGNGNEHIRFPNRSRFGIESTTEKAGHGGTLDEAYIDEAFAQVDGRLEQAFGPAMITRSNTQTGVISTAGWLDGSPYLEAKVSHGRSLVEAGEPARVAYFEWSAPQDADPLDRAVWRACMPALGFTIDEDAIAAELVRFESSPEGLNGFRRAYLNQWAPKGAMSVAIPDEWWVECGDPSSAITGKPTFAVSTSPDGSLTSLLAVGFRSDGLLHVEVVRHGPATMVDAGEVATIARRNSGVVALHPGHAAGSMLPDLEKAGITVQKVTTGDYTRGCGAFYDAVRARRLRYPAPQPELTAALKVAQRRFVGEAWRWSGDGITALVAAAQGVWCVLNRPQGGWMVAL